MWGMHVFGPISLILDIGFPLLGRCVWQLKVLHLCLICPGWVITLSLHSIHIRDRREIWYNRRFSWRVSGRWLESTSWFVHVNIFRDGIDLQWMMHSRSMKRRFYIRNFSVRHYHTRWWYEREKRWKIRRVNWPRSTAFKWTNISLIWFRVSNASKIFVGVQVWCGPTWFFYCSKYITSICLLWGQTVFTLCGYFTLQKLVLRYPYHLLSR